MPLSVILRSAEPGRAFLENTAEAVRERSSVHVFIAEFRAVVEKKSQRPDAAFVIQIAGLRPRQPFGFGNVEVIEGIFQRVLLWSGESLCPRIR